ncbi:serine hydrolase domain-containing protein [Salinispira pacifica]
MNVKLASQRGRKRFRPAARRMGRTFPGSLAAVAVVLVLATGCSKGAAPVESLTGGPTEGTPAFVNRDVADDLTRSAQKALKKNGLKGMAIAVVADDGSSWIAGFGSTGDGTEVTPQTPFMVASLTKVFTAAAVMLLAEDGLVDLDQPIGKYVPEMDGRHYPGSPPPTVRDMMTHHGGIPSDLVKGNIYDGPESEYAEAFMQLVPLIAEQQMTEPPHMLYHYSNIGYTLLGALVTDVSGEPYVDFVRKRILEPAGMRDSGFPDPKSNSILSGGYASGKRVPTLRMRGLPEGGLATSAEDLGRFMSMILSAAGTKAARPVEQVLSPAVVRDMTTRDNADVALDFDYGQGPGFNLMSLPGYPDVRIVWKDGGQHPFASLLLVAPDYGVGVALLSNTDEKVPEGLALEAIERVLKVRGTLPEKRPGYQFGKMAGRPLERSELAGIYMSEIGPIVVGGTPEAPETTLFGTKLHIVSREQGSYGLQARLLGFIPLPIAELNALRIVFREIDGKRAIAIYEGGMFRGVAVAVPPQPVPSAWQARYGHYTAVNPDPQPFFLGADIGYDEELGFMTVSVKVAAIPDPLVLPLVAKDDSTVLTAGMGRRMGDTFRVVQYKGQEALLWAGLMLQRS